MGSGKSGQYPSLRPSSASGMYQNIDAASKIVPFNKKTGQFGVKTRKARTSIRTFYTNTPEISAKSFFDKISNGAKISKQRRNGINITVAKFKDGSSSAMRMTSKSGGPAVNISLDAKMRKKINLNTNKIHFKKGKK